MSVEPTLQEVEAFVAADPDAPVDMLNLLRFAPDGGAERYAKYAARVLEHLQRVGGRITTSAFGDQALVGERWDAMALVHYPSRRAFLEMVTHPSYGDLAELRASALEATVLQATRAWTAEA